MRYRSGEIPQRDPLETKMHAFFKRSIAGKGANNFLVLGTTSSEDLPDFRAPTFVAIFPKPGV